MSFDTADCERSRRRMAQFYARLPQHETAVQEYATFRNEKAVKRVLIACVALWTVATVAICFPVHRHHAAAQAATVKAGQR